MPAVLLRDEMKINSKTVLASSATSFIALCAVVCATWVFHWIDFPLITLFGRRTASVIVYALVFGVPLLSAAALKALFRDRLAGWPYVLIPPIAVLLIAGIGVALFIYFVILPNVA